MMYGYARVSTAAQDHAHQVEALTAAGCQRIFTEKASAAAGRKRPALRQAVAALEAGDCLVVTKLNRLARSARDALNTLAAVQEKGADFKSLGESWADTTTPVGRLAVTIMSALAEFDREMIVERTTEGRRAAKGRGVKLGRPSTLNARQRAYARANRHTASLGELAQLLGVSRSTIVRALKEGEPAEPGAPAWHAPTCAALASGAGAPIRCTCGGIAHGARGLQIDVEEFTAQPGPRHSH